jgi:hypothetical protein
VTNGQALDGHQRRGKSPRPSLSLYGGALRLLLETATASCSTASTTTRKHDGLWAYTQGNQLKRQLSFPSGDEL